MKNKLALFVRWWIMGLFFVYNSNAQTPMPGLQPPEDTTVELSDSGTINKANEDVVLRWKNSRDFAYMHSLDSLLRKQKNLKSDTVSIDKETGKINRSQKGTNDFSALNHILNSLPSKIFFWILAVGFMAIIAYNVLIKNGIFAKRRKKKQVEKEEQAEELSELSQYDALILQAEKENNFNLAVRFLFLKTLKNLTDRGFINFAPDKTNREYSNEMKSNNYFKDFEGLVRNYEYLWYGKFIIDSGTYISLKERFDLFNKKV